MRTRVTDMLGIDIPILAFSHCRDVVAAVTKAGGLGVLGAAGHSDKQLEIDLDWIEEQVGDLPYGVDLIVPAKYTGSDQGGMTVAELGEMIPGEHRDFVDGRPPAGRRALPKRRGRRRRLVQHARPRRPQDRRRWLGRPRHRPRLPRSRVAPNPRPDR